MSVGIYKPPWVFIYVSGYLYMLVGIYKWVFIYVTGYLYMSPGTYKCLWVFINVYGIYIIMSVGIYYLSVDILNVCGHL